MPSSRDPRSDDPDRRPLDELFVVGAKYHEPTAAERAAAAKRAEKEHEKTEKQRAKDIAHTRKVLGLDGHTSRGGTDRPYDRRNTAIAFGGLVLFAALLATMGFGG